MEVREGALLEHQDDHSATVSVHTLTPRLERAQEHAGLETQAIIRLFSRRLAHPQTQESNLRSYNKPSKPSITYN